MALTKKLLLTLLLFLFTASAFEGMIIKSLAAACQGYSQRKYIKLVLILTGALFQVCFIIIGKDPVYLTLFFIRTVL